MELSASQEPDNEGGPSNLIKSWFGDASTGKVRCSGMPFTKFSYLHLCIYILHLEGKNMRIFQKIAMEVGTVRRAVFDEIRAKVSGCTYLNFTDWIGAVWKMAAFF